MIISKIMLTKVKADLAEFISQQLNLDQGKVFSSMEVPKELSHGHLAFPVFFLAKEWRKAPPLIAKEIQGKLEATNQQRLAIVKAVGGYVNFVFKDSYLQDVLMQAIEEQKDCLGCNSSGQDQTMVIDYSSPNVAKPMHIGHLRSTMIGQAIANLAKTQGYKVVGLNHLGDWGVQFGKLAWAYREWGSEYDFDGKPFESLYSLYRRFHDEEDKDASITEKGAATFKQLEDGDAELHKLWRMFVDISMAEYDKMFELLGIKHDLVRGESFYNDRLKSTEKLLEEKGLLQESEGATVVALDELDMPPCLIRKSDGASLYATRDLASAIYRAEELKADLNVYETGQEQILHFKQVFAVLEKMKFPWAKNCHHVSHGMYRFKDVGKMSSRKGQVIVLKDVLTKAINMVREIIEEKNPSLEDKDTVARQVGVGAIIFNDLMNDRVKNVEFDWDRVFDFEGDSGPYVQYTVVRCKSIIRKVGKPVPAKIGIELTSDHERQLIKLLLAYDEILSGAFSGFKPHVLATYLLEVCRAFGHFYHSCRIKGEADEVEQSRLTLVWATQRVLESGLGTLNIEAPDMM